MSAVINADVSILIYGNAPSLKTHQRCCDQLTFVSVLPVLKNNWTVLGKQEEFIYSKLKYLRSNDHLSSRNTQRAEVWRWWEHVHKWMCETDVQCQKESMWHLLNSRPPLELTCVIKLILAVFKFCCVHDITLSLMTVLKEKLIKFKWNSISHQPLTVTESLSHLIMS